MAAYRLLPSTAAANMRGCPATARPTWRSPRRTTASRRRVTGLLQRASRGELELYGNVRTANRRRRPVSRVVRSVPSGRAPHAVAGPLRARAAGRPPRRARPGRPDLLRRVGHRAPRRPRRRPRPAPRRGTRVRPGAVPGGPAAGGVVPPPGGPAAHLHPLRRRGRAGAVRPAVVVTAGVAAGRHRGQPDRVRE